LQRSASSLGCHGSLSLLFVMKVMVWHFVSSSCKVITAYCCCEVSFIMSWLHSLWCHLWIIVVRFLCNLIDIQVCILSIFWPYIVLSEEISLSSKDHEFKFLYVVSLIFLSSFGVFFPFGSCFFLVHLFSSLFCC
jgi:hypothetical protein